MRKSLEELAMEIVDAVAANIRRECTACGGTGVGGTTVGPDGETPEAVECEYCGRPMSTVRVPDVADRIRDLLPEGHVVTRDGQNMVVETQNEYDLRRLHKAAVNLSDCVSKSIVDGYIKTNPLAKDRP